MALTPMMVQYLETKRQNPDALLFFRLGDFYELFFDDAVVASRELELTLTGKECGLAERAPMCGVPYHAVETYIARLIEKGYRVAICEQMTDPAESKGLVERAVTRIVTPGTVIEASMLDERSANYLMGLCLQKDRAGVAFCDVSTGAFRVYEFSGARARLGDEMARIAPCELLVNDDALYRSLAKKQPLSPTPFSSAAFEPRAAADAVKGHFGQSMRELGLETMKLAASAAGALLAYLGETQKNALRHILKVEIYRPERFMALDATVRRCLELTESMRGRGRKGSLMGLIDRASTSMGSRLLREWLLQPLADRAEIEARLDAVARLLADPMRMDATRDALSPVRDIERLLSRIAYDNIGARDCLALARSLSALPALRALYQGEADGLLAEAAGMLVELGDVEWLLNAAINPDAPLSVKEGNIIRPGYDAELDKLRRASTEGKEWIAALEQQERETTGIKNLKVGYNRVFGFYIEVTKSYYDLVPMRYQRKQTLASCERFITQELKDLEQKVLGAEDNAIRLEYRLFTDIRGQLNAALDRLSTAAQGIKTLDALCALSQVAIENGYVRPRLNDDGVYNIRGGRHPVVEESLGREHFVPNDTTLNQDERVMILTGPNMAGKSTYMRQVALIALMAHMGSFVPADEADIALTDRIFTRIGASDDLYGGQSTFMVEMSEMASILKYATSKSLII
ncbi:MAG: DNA mismatch repair protein MutS, partial [Clostridiales bacterium]|nr:DNA mismatch repair protein MutS [Clostridiales bacterium]